jgi:hypothetical protein
MVCIPVLQPPAVDALHVATGYRFEIWDSPDLRLSFVEFTVWTCHPKVGWVQLCYILGPEGLADQASAVYRCLLHTREWVNLNLHLKYELKE